MEACGVLKVIKKIVKDIMFLSSRMYNWILFKVHRVSYGRGVRTTGRIGIYRSGNLHLGN